MNDISVLMAAVDLIPVILFFMGCISLMKAFYPQMKVAQYSAFSAGSIMVFLAGMMKVIWKFLYAFGIGDYALLSDAFFPIHSTGFLLLAISTAAFSGKKEELHSLAVPAITTKLPFIILTFWGTTGFYASMCRICFKHKQKITALFFIGAYVLDMVQVFLASKFDNSASMNWIAEIINTFAQICLCIGAKRLYQEYQNI